jgi:hypothetical protein
MRLYGLKTSTSVDRVGKTILISVSLEDERLAEAMTEVLVKRQLHGALVLDLSRPFPAVIDGTAVRQ